MCGGWGKEGNKEGLWPRVNEDAPMAAGSGWEWPEGRPALLKESGVDRVAL